MLCAVLKSSDGGIGIFLGILILVAIAVLWYYSRRERVLRAIRKFRSTGISDVKDGQYARVTGKVTAAGETMRAPLSGRPCVYYHVVVKESGQRNVWIVLEEEMMADVILKDATGYALVKTDHPQSYIRKDRFFSSGFLNDPNERMVALLKRNGQEPDGYVFNRLLSYEEGMLEPGEEFTVAGTCTWEPTHEHGLKLPVQRILVIRTSDQADVLLTDHKKTVKYEP